MADRITRFDFEGYCVHYNASNGRFASTPYLHELQLNEYFEMIDFTAPPRELDFFPKIVISVNLTIDCNLRCLYCFNHEKRNHTTSLQNTFSFIKKIVQNSPKAQRFFVDFTGSGEPLLMLPHILSVANYCKQLSDEFRKEITVMLATNGLLLNKRTVDVLRENSILFGISLDGYRENHDKFRLDLLGRPTFDRIVRNISQIDDMSFIGAAMTVASDDTDIFKSYSFLAQHFETISIRFARMDYSSFSFSLALNGYSQVSSLIIEEARRDSIDFISRIINGEDFFGKQLVKYIASAFMNRRCDAGLGRYSLSPDGNVYICAPAIFDTRGVLSLAESDFIDCHDANINALHSNARAHCKECLLLSFCGGRCIVDNQNSLSDRAFCDFQKAVFRIVLRTMGFIQMTCPGLYLSLQNLVTDIIMRNYADASISEVLQSDGNSLTFTQLKSIKDKNPEAFRRIHDAISSDF